MSSIRDAIQSISDVLNDPHLDVDGQDREDLFYAIGILLDYETVDA
jgi:hypothetical protein